MLKRCEIENEVEEKLKLDLKNGNLKNYEYYNDILVYLSSFKKTIIIILLLSLFSVALFILSLKYPLMLLLSGDFDLVKGNITQIKTEHESPYSHNPESYNIHYTFEANGINIYSQDYTSSLFQKIIYSTSKHASIIYNKANPENNNLFCIYYLHLCISLILMTIDLFYIKSSLKLHKQYKNYVLNRQ